MKTIRALKRSCGVVLPASGIVGIVLQVPSKHFEGKAVPASSSSEAQFADSPVAVRSERVSRDVSAEDSSGTSGDSTLGGSSGAGNTRDLKGAAADDDNSSAAAELKARLAR